MQILLVKPHSYGSSKGIGPPLGLGYIAAVLLENGHQVHIEDLMLAEISSTEEVYKAKFKEVSPDIVGITCNSHERFYSFDIARWTKEISNIKVIMGGPHVTFTAEETLENIPYVDIIVRHEGELTMRELCGRLEKGQPFDDIKGISFRDDGGKVRTNPPRPFISNLDTLPFPARHLFRMEKYDLHLPVPDKPRVADLMTSRGCPFRCRFCSGTLMAGTRIRMRSPQNCVAEMAQVLSQYPWLDGLFIHDDHFTFNKRRAIDICNEIKKRGLHFRWGCDARVDSIDRELAHSLRSSGCEVVVLGVESGSLKLLKAMNKEITPEQSLEAIRILKSEGIIPYCAILFNYPSESFLDILKTHFLMAKARLAWHEYVASGVVTLYPRTELFDRVQGLGYLPHNFNWEERFNIPSYKDVPIYIPRYRVLRGILHMTLNILRNFYVKLLSWTGSSGCSGSIPIEFPSPPTQ